MAKGYRPVLRDQPMLLPEDMRCWLPEDHLAWFVVEVVEALDTSDLDGVRRVGGAGRAGYDPRMMLGLLVYAYSCGVRSSRRIEQLCSTDVAFRVLCAQDVPDHATIARFRVDCQEQFADLFRQVLLVAARAGLARFATVAIDGTKLAADASIDANRGQDWLADQVAGMLDEAQAVDEIEDHSGMADGDRLPGPLSRRSDRAARIRQAAAQVGERVRRDQESQWQREAHAQSRRQRSERGEAVVGRIPDGPHRLAEAQAHLARQVAGQQAKLDRRAAIIASGRTPCGPPPRPVEEHSHVIRARRAVANAEAAQQAAEQAAQVRAQSKPLAARVGNITDPQSRLMPTRRGFLQGYNVQVAVTADQVIVALEVVQDTNDQNHLIPMMSATTQIADHLYAATGDDRHRVGTLLADAGYASDDNLAAPGPQRLIALGKGRDQARRAHDDPLTGPPPPGCTPRQAMAHTLRTEQGMTLYRRRGATVEPAIGNLKKIIDRLSRRGLDPARAEIHLAATAFNIRKIHRAAPA
jgi:transposase